MRPTTIEQTFNFPLSDSRLAEIAREIGDNLERVKTLEEAFEAAKEAKKEVPPLLHHVRELGHFINNGAETKPVVCFINYDTPEPGLKTIVRSDTNEIVDTLQMTGEELQGELGIDKDGKLTLPDPPSDGPEDDKDPDE
ncbi:MAG: hypothetical protein ACYC09_15160 [Bacteroidota bacterium]